VASGDTPISIALMAYVAAECREDDGATADACTATRTKKRARILLASQLTAISFYTYLGESIRRLVEHLFGLACHIPGSVVWNESQWAPCTTAPGTTSATGGAMFTDIPANMLGCFFMGLMVSGGAALPGGSADVESPMACFPHSHAFQTWTATHLGLRSGLYGSLTTFASWNTQMIVMICAGKGTVLGTQWVSALFGYLIGWMAAMQSFTCGRDVAIALHRRHNPDLRRQTDDRENHRRHLVQQDLLALLDDDLAGEENKVDSEEKIDEEDIHSLSQAGNYAERHRFSGPVIDSLREIQDMIHVRKKPRENLIEVARNAGYSMNKRLPHWAQWQEEARLGEIYTVEFVINLFAFLSVTALLIWGGISVSGSDPSSISYRTYFVATLFSPFGTILRWHLSQFNGSIHNPRWEWLPLGTFSANMIASAISALMAAASLKVDGQLGSLFIEAIQFGFAGCLSTVSTFVVEVESLMQALPQHAYGYYYSLLSLGSAAVLGIVCYLWAVV